ncbi:MAG: hypothetical protein ACYC63_14700 [Armatimonadota bacterium]
MRPPSWVHNPNWSYTLLLATAGVCLMWLAHRLVSHAWRPSYLNVEYALIGAVVCTACTIANYLVCRRLGDRYPLQLLRGGVPVWQIPLGLLPSLALLRLGLAQPWDLALSYILGLLLALVPWYRYASRIWKRMWELYEQDQNADPPSAGSVP